MSCWTIEEPSTPPLFDGPAGCPAIGRNTWWPPDCGGCCFVVPVGALFVVRNDGRNRKMRVVAIEDHGVTDPVDHGGGLVSVSCRCGRFRIQGTLAEVDREMERHLAWAGQQAGIDSELVAA